VATKWTNKPCVIVVEDPPIIVPVLALPVFPREGYNVDLKEYIDGVKISRV
jgi:hypothetical protein